MTDQELEIERRMTVKNAEIEARELIKRADDFAGRIVLTTLVEQSTVDAMYEAVQNFKTRVRECYARTRIEAEEGQG